MAKQSNCTEAVAYLRTSSAANVGADKDSDQRQRAAIAAFAKTRRFAVVGEFNDAAVSGADPIDSRPGFAALLDRIEGNGVRTVIVEDASRFARDLIIQELGILALIRRGVRVLTAGGDDLTDTSDPSRVMMRQIAGSFAQYEKCRLVSKLRAARDRALRANAKAAKVMSRSIRPWSARPNACVVARRRGTSGHYEKSQRSLRALDMSTAQAARSRPRRSSPCLKARRADRFALASAPHGTRRAGLAGGQGARLGAGSITGLPPGYGLASETEAASDDDSKSCRRRTFCPLWFNRLRAWNGSPAIFA
jgi:DNA invertase Pin-like site-specific DNA recombinase